MIKSCLVCGTLFDSLESDCGAGTSWTILKCVNPECKQLHAEKMHTYGMNDGFFPEEVLNDKRIIKVPDMKREGYLL